jgi:hypothetical protein
MVEIIMTLYLYQSPFIDDDKNADRYGIGYRTEEDREDERRVRDVIIRFIVRENLATFAETGFVINQETNMGSWLWTVPRMSMRSLVYPEPLLTLINSLTVGNGDVMERILHLHMTLGCMVDHSVLNNLCDRTIKSVAMIPYQQPQPHHPGEILTPMQWEEIHRLRPFLWVIIYLQSILISGTL